LVEEWQKALNTALMAADLSRFLVLLVLSDAACQQLVAPGGMTPYSGGGGGGGGPRYGGRVRISEPMVGFFLAGSSLDEVNGVYGPRMHDPHAELPPEIASTLGHGAYRHHISGWLLAHVNTALPEGHVVQEWVLFDAQNRERFATRSPDLIPSSGSIRQHPAGWDHLHREPRAQPPPVDANNGGGGRGGGGGDDSGGDSGGGGGGSRGGPTSESTQLRTSTGDDDDQLPWQVIGIRDAHKVESLR